MEEEAGATDIVPCYRATDSPEAALVATMLRGHGIQAEIMGESFSAGYGELVAGVPGVEVWVQRNQRDEALMVIETFLEQQKADRMRSPTSEWTCAECGELNTGGLAICWNCQAPAP